MARAYKAGVYTPYLLFVNETEKSFGMQYIDNSITLKEYMLQAQLPSSILSQIATSVAKLHNSDLYHGDLTTCNILI